MRRIVTVRLDTIFVIALMIMIMILIASNVSSASSNTSFLPSLYKPATATTALIYECQCGAVSAKTLQNGNVELTILDHTRGGLIVVGVDNGNFFREYETPITGPAHRTVPSPSFQFPGDKQGIGDTVDAFGRKVTYAPNRTEEGGRYNIWRYVYDPTFAPASTSGKNNLLHGLPILSRLLHPMKVLWYGTRGSHMISGIVHAISYTFRSSRLKNT